MRLVFFSHATQIPSFASLAGLLRRECDISSELWTLGGPDFEVGRDFSEFTQVHNLLTDFEPTDLSRETHRANLEWFRDLEEELGEIFLHRDISMDRYFREASTVELWPSRTPARWDAKKSTALLRAVGEFTLRALAERNISAFYMETNSAPYRLTWRLARHRDIPSYCFQSSRHWPYRGYLETELDFNWLECRRTYRRFGNEDIPSELATRSQTRLDEIRTEREKTAGSNMDNTTSLLDRLGLEKVSYDLGRWFNSYRDSWKKNPRVLPPSAVSPPAKMRRWVDTQSSEDYYERHFRTDLDMDGSYAVFFLHVPREMTKMCMAFEYQDQVTTIRNLSAALPANVPLVVKEHTPAAGRRHLFTYGELVHDPNMILAHDQVDSHELIRNAEVVLTLTGTVGLESIYYGVPALVLGNVFFNTFKGIYHPENYDEITNLLGCPGDLQGADDEDAIRTLAAMYEASFEGAHHRDHESKPELLEQTARRLAERIRDSAGSAIN